jgi:hypothetical protein
MEQQIQNPVNAVLSEFSTRLNEMEEKQRLLKDRLLLVGENLVSTKEEYEKQFLEFKSQIKQLELDVRNLKQLTKRMTEILDEFARKSDLEILSRQAKMFQPLEFARVSEIREIIRQEMENSRKK